MIRVPSVVSNYVHPRFLYGHHAAAWILNCRPSPLSSAIKGQNRSLSIVSKCPEPNCSCAQMPPDLDIDHSKPMKGALPFYSQHVVIKTGQDDWSSRIEDDKDGHNLAKQLKVLLGAGGKYHNVRSYSAIQKIG